MQTITSKYTSINKCKVPALYKKLPICEGTKILDVGCGRYDTAKDYTIENGGIWYGFDPFWNRFPVGLVRSTLDIVVSSNVLNVIKEDEEVQNIVNSMCNYVNRYGTALYVSVYEGNKSGKGKQTGIDTYQRNEKASAYLRFFPSDFVLKKGIITNRPETI